MKGGQVTEADVLADALGGAANIHDVEPCVTRVRVEVHDPHLVDHGALRDFGALAVVVAGPVIQVVVGHTADELAADLERLRRESGREVG